MKRTLTALALAAVTASAGCSDDPEVAAKAEAPEGARTTVRISDTSTPGNWSFDKKTLTARAGTVTIELHNDSKVEAPSGTAARTA